MRKLGFLRRLVVVLVFGIAVGLANPSQVWANSESVVWSFGGLGDGLIPMLN